MVKMVHSHVGTVSGGLVIGDPKVVATLANAGVEVLAGDVQLDSGNVVNTAGFNIESFAAITAGTTQTQAGATPITTQMSYVTTGNASDGLILPVITKAGQVVKIINSSAAAGVLYAPGTTNTNTINGTAGATGVAYAASKTLTLIATGAHTWVSTLSN